MHVRLQNVHTCPHTHTWWLCQDSGGSIGGWSNLNFLKNSDFTSLQVKIVTFNVCHCECVTDWCRGDDRGENSHCLGTDWKCVCHIEPPPNTHTDTHMHTQRQTDRHMHTVHGTLHWELQYVPSFCHCSDSELLSEYWMRLWSYIWCQFGAKQSDIVAIPTVFHDV